MKKASFMSTFLFIISILILTVSIILFVLSVLSGGQINYLIPIYLIILTFILAFFSYLVDLENKQNRK